MGTPTRDKLAGRACTQGSTQAGVQSSLNLAKKGYRRKHSPDEPRRIPVRAVKCLHFKPTSHVKHLEWEEWNQRKRHTLDSRTPWNGWDSCMRNVLERNMQPVCGETQNSAHTTESSCLKKQASMPTGA